MTDLGLFETNCPTLKLVKRGKVRDIYEFPNDETKLIFVSTDRISAFDIIMKNVIPNKGKLLTKLTLYFFKKFQFKIKNHLISIKEILNNPNLNNDFNLNEIKLEEDKNENENQDENEEEDEFNYNKILNLNKNLKIYKNQFKDRILIIKKINLIKCESIIRGYLTGSAFNEFKKFKTINDINFEDQNLLESSKFLKPIFTPTTKADLGDHDENINPNKLSEILGSKDLANQIEKVSLELYKTASEHCQNNNSGLILADTKLEFGLDSNSNELILVDECFTPDSSRFWKAEDWAEGKKMVGFDKEYLRDWLKNQGVDGKESMEIPPDIIQATWQRYLEAYELLTGEKFVC